MNLNTTDGNVKSSKPEFTSTARGTTRRRLLLQGLKAAPVVVLSAQSMSALAAGGTATCSVLMSVTPMNSHHTNIKNVTATTSQGTTTYTYTDTSQPSGSQSQTTTCP